MNFELVIITHFCLEAEFLDYKKIQWRGYLILLTEVFASQDVISIKMDNGIGSFEELYKVCNEI